MASNPSGRSSAGHREQPFDPSSEWLEADGLGGFAMGTVGLVRDRRYHALLCTATTPPTGRMVLVNGCEVALQTAAGSAPLSAQRYHPDVVHPRGDRNVVGFSLEPWPTWTFRLPDGTQVEHELFVPRGHSCVVLCWRLPKAVPAARLTVRPLLSGRDYHALLRENADFTAEAAQAGGHIAFPLRGGAPCVLTLSNGAYRHDPLWYRNFLYREEAARSFDAVEDLLAPGEFTFDLARRQALLVFAAGELPAELRDGPLANGVARLRERERSRRGGFASRLHHAAADYVVARGRGRTIVAGYPWFTDWGRDTFIALRGLCLATGERETARDILCEWAAHVSAGMLPNCFPDRGGAPEFNSVDAALWFVVAAHEYLAGPGVAAADRDLLQRATLAIVAGYAQGTRHGIAMDEDDGLLAAGAPGLQLTWMDARVDGVPVTPRIGKPVEVQALWYNALAIAQELEPRWREPAVRARTAFAARFWNEERRCLHDVVDVDHERGRVDGLLRPNQILAIGGLPLPLLDGDRARAVVDCVEQRLWTPMGLRSLAPGEPGYAARYEGGPQQRDRAYHNGTVWPWLQGPFVEAWVRVRGGTRGAKAAARARFVLPLQRHLDEAGLGHVSEIADAEPPHTPRGCPFQAWSLGELLRLEHVVLAGG